MPCPLRRGHPVHRRKRQLRRVNPESLRLVAVTDEPGDDRSEWLGRVAAAVRGGASSVQVRAKKLDSRSLLELVRHLVATLPVPVFVNDRADIAMLANAAGVHVGPVDLPVAMIRAIAPPSLAIGASVGSLAELENARGADYVGIGPAFVARSKADAGPPLEPREIEALARAAGVPAVAIGGITPENAGEILASCPSLAGVAAVSALFSSPDVERAARALAAAIGR